MMIRKEYHFYGQVQGVGFRYQAKYAAKYAGATGWIRNEYDGSVTMQIQGTPEQIEEVLHEIDDGRFIYIERLEETNIPPVDGERGFGVRYH